MATIRDVAARAGVSASTVSYVITGNKRLSPDTVRRVRESIAALDYRPDPAARALSLGRTNVVGLLVQVQWHGSETEADIFMRFVRSAMFTAQRSGFDLMVMSTGDDDRPINPLVDALLVMDVRLHDTRLPAIRRMGLPTVLIGRPADSLGLTSVDLDFEAAGAVAVGHLARLGHTSVAVLAPPLDTAVGELSFVARFRTGAQRAGDDAGVRTHYAESGSSADDLGAWMRAAAEALGSVSAVVVLHTDALDGLLRHLDRAGTSIPGDLSLIVVAPDERMAPLHPAITLIDLPGRAMMETAVDQVLGELDGQTRGTATLLPPQLIERASTAAPVTTPSGTPPR